jgi:hypothetical protein
MTASITGYRVDHVSVPTNPRRKQFIGCATPGHRVIQITMLERSPIGGNGDGDQWWGGRNGSQAEALIQDGNIRQITELKPLAIVS